jgi:methylthioribose-1-phosphate isomerase
METGRFGEPAGIGDTILTHCFAGPDCSTCSGSREKGKEIRVFCTETRPYLQGARLTAWSVSALGLETVLITETWRPTSCPAGRSGRCSPRRTGSPGTAPWRTRWGPSPSPIAAHRYGVPFYVLGYGGPDRRTEKGADIPIEERISGEVLRFQGIPITGPLVKAGIPHSTSPPPNSSPRW